MPFLLDKAKGCFELSEINLQEAYFLEWISVIIEECFEKGLHKTCPLDL